MERPVTPKRLQREGKYEEALEGFWTRYLNCLKEGDRFLSGLYMDEIVQTLLLSHYEERVSQPQLRGHLEELRPRVPPSRMDDYEEDIEIALSKRFPMQFGVEREKVIKED